MLPTRNGYEARMLLRFLKIESCSSLLNKRSFIKHWHFSFSTPNEQLLQISSFPKGTFQEIRKSVILHIKYFLFAPWKYFHLSNVNNESW